MVIEMGMGKVGHILIRATKYGYRNWAWAEWDIG